MHLINLNDLIKRSIYFVLLVGTAFLEMYYSEDPFFWADAVVNLLSSIPYVDTLILK